MTVRLLGITITDMHGSLYNARIFGPDGVGYEFTADIANQPPDFDFSYTWRAKDLPEE